ncbi:MAG: glycosyltransferase family 2 protein [Methylococcales bacterium]|nr:glycosyltransferase family 2 protein [Methylococcales bacterium]
MAKISVNDFGLVSVSIVSHGQASLVSNLLQDIEQYKEDLSLEVILTVNIEEPLPFIIDNFSYPIKIIRNNTPLGFGANHNQAFKYASGLFFCVLNPDIRFNINPFSILINKLNVDSIGVIAPLVLSPNNEIEDSARKFPTPFRILCKALGERKGSDYIIDNDSIYPDWVGGMFMLFPRKIFEQIRGFDERYFLYYEDVNLCARLRLLGYDIMLSPQAKVFHHAQRTSHANLKYLRWHLTSMLRFFFSFEFVEVQYKKLSR